MTTFSTIHNAYILIRLICYNQIYNLAKLGKMPIKLDI